MADILDVERIVLSGIVMSDARSIALAAAREVVRQLRKCGGYTWHTQDWLAEAEKELSK